MFHVFFDRNSTDHFRGSRGSISNSMGIIQNFEKIRRTLLGFSVFHCNIKMVSHLLLTPFPVVSTCLTCFYRRLLNYSSSYRGRQLTQLSKGISSKFISRDGSGAVPKETHAIFSWTRRGSQLRSIWLVESAAWWYVLLPSCYVFMGHWSTLRASIKNYACFMAVVPWTS